MAVGLTVVVGFVSPVLQTFICVALDVSFTESPTQIAVAPPAVMVGVAGNGLTVTVVTAEAAEHPYAFLTVTK